MRDHLSDLGVLSDLVCTICDAGGIIRDSILFRVGCADKCHQESLHIHFAYGDVEEWLAVDPATLRIGRLVVHAA